MQLREHTRKQLLELPRRPYSLTTRYSSLIVFPSATKHESGWGNITVIGCRDCVPVEIVTTGADDLAIEGNHRIDCLHKAKALHFWRNNAEFECSHALSSMTIKVVPKS
jgi:hypothetical protein